jgi:hypothetical protein
MAELLGRQRVGAEVHRFVADCVNGLEQVEEQTPVHVPVEARPVLVGVQQVAVIAEGERGGGLGARARPMDSQLTAPWNVPSSAMTAGWEYPSATIVVTTLRRDRPGGTDMTPLPAASRSPMRRVSGGRSATS